MQHAVLYWRLCILWWSLELNSFLFVRIKAFCTDVMSGRAYSATKCFRIISWLMHSDEGKNRTSKIEVDRGQTATMNSKVFHLTIRHHVCYVWSIAPINPNYVVRKTFTHKMHVTIDIRHIFYLSVLCCVFCVSVESLFLMFLTVAHFHNHTLSYNMTDLKM